MGPRAAGPMRRLGRNHGRYCGEAIDIRAVLADCQTAAARSGWSAEVISSAVSPPIIAFHRGGRSGALSAEAAPEVTPSRRRIYLSAGIHGDEPAGPLALRRLLIESAWPDDAELWVCPCLNPTGFPLNQRENAAGVDLNRDYRQPRSPEVQSHVAWLSRQGQFDLTICLHEDWEASGFYLYEVNPEGRPSASSQVIAAVEAVCPIDRSPVIEGRPAAGGIIRPQIDLVGRPDWPEAFHLISDHTRLSYTLEAPSDYPLPVRVEALVVAVKTLLDSVK